MHWRGHKLFHRSFFSPATKLDDGIDRQSGLTSNPSLHRRLAQNWCPLRLRINTSPHSAQTTGSRGLLLRSSAFIILLSKKSPGDRRNWMSISERAGGGDPCPRQPPGATSPALGFVLIAALKRLARLGLAISGQSFGTRRRARRSAHENTVAVFCVMSALPPVQAVLVLAIATGDMRPY